MSPLEEDVILYKHTQVGMVTRVPELNEVCSLIIAVPPGLANSIDLPKGLEALSALLLIKGN